MNIADVFFNNGELNWGAISTISNIILVGVLVYITWWYAKQVKKQTEFMKIDRLVKEMDRLVAPLYSKIGDEFIFQKEIPYYINGNMIKPNPEYSCFWDEIKQTKYLGPDYLRSAIDNYLRNKSDKVNDKTRDASYEKAETELFEAIKRRYSELENEISCLR
jgi:hypothetical protein